MAKDVEFESEKLVRRQKIMRFVLPLAALVVVVLLTVAVALIIRGERGETFTGGEDTLYPYAWSIERDGSILLEIDQSASPGYSWTATREEAGISVEKTRTQREGKARFSIKPTYAMRSTVTFRLVPDGGEGDAIYEMTLLLESLPEGEKLVSGLLGVNSQPLQETVTGGEDSSFPYFIRMDEDGDLTISVSEIKADSEETLFSSDSIWECVSDNEEIAEVIGVISEGGATTAYIRPGLTAGTCTVCMSEVISGTEIIVECENGGNRSLVAVDHTLLLEGER